MEGHQITQYLKGQVSKAKNRIIYGSTFSDPHKLIYMNPEKIRYKLIPFFQEWVPSLTQTYVVGGEWDRRYADEGKIYPRDYEYFPRKRTLVRVKDLDWYRSFESHFEQGTPWEETELYRRRIEEKFKTNRYNSEKGLQERLADIERLYQHIKSEGYKTQSELAKENSTPLQAEDWTHEIRINIGRDGEPILDDGRNRLILTQLLNMPEIPVRVLVRHKKWQKIRMRLARTNDLEEVPKTLHQYLGHPDLEDVVTFESY